MEIPATSKDELLIEPYQFDAVLTNERTMGKNGESRQLNFAWMERLLVLAVLGLVLQLFPSVLPALDPRYWSRSAWLGANLLVILSLFIIRFAREFHTDWEQRSIRLDRSRRKTVVRFEIGKHADEYAAREARDAEWCERAKKRMRWS